MNENEAESEELTKKPLVSDKLSILLIGLIAIGGMVLMCIIVLGIAIWKS